MLALGPATLAATPRYPDLRTLPASDLGLDVEEIDGAEHHVLRFTSTIWNAGQGPLELRGDSSSGSTQAYQQIRVDDGTAFEIPVGRFVFHPSHNHWHFERFADHELWRASDYKKWLKSGRTRGAPAWRGSKTTSQGESVCIRDSERIESLPGSPSRAFYNSCQRDWQGISIGWGDTYDYTLPDQWIDLGQDRLRQGKYVLRSIADPANLIHESGDKADSAREAQQVNEAVTRFRLRKGKITILDP